jgi:hypothetical protein
LRLCVEQAIVGVTVQDAAEGEHDDEPETLIDGGTDRTGRKIPKRALRSSQSSSISSPVV